jgi:hypothetical protein
MARPGMMHAFELDRAMRTSILLTVNSLSTDEYLRQPSHRSH